MGHSEVATIVVGPSCQGLGTGKGQTMDQDRPWRSCSVHWQAGFILGPRSTWPDRSLDNNIRGADHRIVVVEDTEF